MNDILVLKENGSLVKELQANEQAIIYQSLDTTIDNIDLNLKENASLVLLTFNNGTIKDVNLKSTLARGASLTIYNMIISIIYLTRSSVNPISANSPLHSAEGISRFFA